MRKKNEYYCNLETNELREVLAEKTLQMTELKKKRQALTKEIGALNQKRRQIKQTLYNREKSQYNGEHWIKSEFRQKYNKPFSKLTEEEKREYYKEYYQKQSKEN